MWIVKWTPEAENQFYDILDFWTKNNNSNSYSQKIYLETKEITSLLSLNPFIGKEHRLNTEYTKIRSFIILNKYSLIYRVTDIIEIISFFDNRQDPKKLKSLF